MRDLGIDLDRHASNLHQLRTVLPAGWTFLRRARLGALDTLAATSKHRSLIASIVRDQAIVLAALHARMLAEHLRRLATEPMGPRIDEDEPLWPLRGRVLLDRLGKPARSVDRLMKQTLRGATSFRAALEQALASGHLAYDPHLIGMARRVHQRCVHLTGDDSRKASALMTRAVHERLGPLLTIRHGEVRDSGLGRQSFAEAQLGLSAPQAVTVLAMNLVAFPSRLNAALTAMRAGEDLPTFDLVPPALAGTDGRVRRITTMLKAISGCDRYVGDARAEPDNKTGRTLLRETKALLHHAEPPHGLDRLHIVPQAWLR